MRKKEKWTNKRTDKKEDAYSLTQYKSNPMFVQTFKILGHIVSEQTLTQICLCLTFE